MSDANTLASGAVVCVVFHHNVRVGSRFRLRATHVDGRRAPKAILTNDVRIRAGERVHVRLTEVHQPQAEGRGHALAEFVSRAPVQFGEDLWVDPLVAVKLQALLESGLNILLDGPQGCGKTVLSQRIAAAMGYTYVFFNCASVYEATDFLASVQVRATPSGAAETVWVPTDILRALEEAHADPSRRFLVFLDELNRGREMARNGIMPALDATRRLFNPMTGSAVAIPANVQWIAAVNSGAQFTGTTSVDPAQLDRFAPLRISYPPEEQEIRILRSRYADASVTHVTQVVRAANAMRSDAAFRVELSVRATEEAWPRSDFMPRSRSQTSRMWVSSFIGSRK